MRAVFTAAIRRSRVSVPLEYTERSMIAQKGLQMSLILFRNFSEQGLQYARSIAILLALVAAVFGHTAAVSMTPAADSTVSAPANVTIKFSGALEPKFSTITVTNAEGHVVNKEASAVGSDHKVMTVPLPSLPAGVYTVHWVGVSTDTHRSQGDYKFTVE